MFDIESVTMFPVIPSKNLIQFCRFRYFSCRPYYGRDDCDDDDDNLCPVEAAPAIALDEGENFNELEHILELESVPKDLMVLQRRR